MVWAACVEIDVIKELAANRKIIYNFISKVIPGKCSTASSMKGKCEEK